MRIMSVLSEPTHQHPPLSRPSRDHTGANLLGDLVVLQPLAMTLSSRHAGSIYVGPSPNFGGASSGKPPDPHDGLEPERQIDVQTGRNHPGAQIVDDDLAGTDMPSKLLGEGGNHEF